MFNYTMLPRKLFLVGIVVIICIVPKAILFREQYIDPYSYSSASLAQQYLQEGEIELYPFRDVTSTWQNHANGISERPAPSLFLVFLSLLTSVPIRRLSFLPLTGLVFIILFFVFARMFSNSNSIASLCIVTLSFDLLINMSTFNVYYIAYGFNLLLLFMIVYLKTLEANEKNRSYVCLLLIIFLSSFFSYYTGEFLSIVFSWCIAAVAVVFKKQKLKSRYLPIAFLIVFTAFDQVFGKYVSWQPWTKGISYLQEFAGYIIGFLTHGASAAQERGHFIGNPSLIYIEFLLRMLIFLPVAVYSGYFLIRLTKDHKLRKKTEVGLKELTYFSVVLVVIAEVAVYVNMGVIDYRGFFLFFPLLTFCSLTELAKLLKKRHYEKGAFVFMVLSILIASLTISKFVVGLQDQSSLFTGSYYDLMMPSTSWATINVDNGSIVTNYQTAGVLFQEVVFEQKANNVLIYFPQFDEVVDFLVSKNATHANDFFRQKDFDYVLLSNEFKKKVIHIGAWSSEGRVAPLGASTFTLNNFTMFNKIYDDGNGLLYFYTHQY